MLNAVNSVLADVSSGIAMFTNGPALPRDIFVLFTSSLTYVQIVMAAGPYVYRVPCTRVNASTAAFMAVF